MAAKIFVSKKIYRTQFRDLPDAGIYYLDAGTGPFVKTGRRTRLATNSIPGSSGYADTAIADTSVAVRRVRPNSTHQTF